MIRTFILIHLVCYNGVDGNAWENKGSTERMFAHNKTTNNATNKRTNNVTNRDTNNVMNNARKEGTNKQTFGAGNKGMNNMTNGRTNR